MNSNCDRRKSRAARALLIHKTLPILLHYRPDDYQQYEGLTEEEKSNPGSSSSSSNASHRHELQLYRDSLMELMTHPNQNTCILNPNRDIFWEEELHYTTAKPKFKQQKTLASEIAASGDGFLHKCHVCGKTFYSRYYLDRHMENIHSGRSVSNTMPMICPAVQQCKLLGGNLCDRRALKEEPFYAPGIVYRDSRMSWPALVVRSGDDEYFGAPTMSQLSSSSSSDSGSSDRSDSGSSDSQPSSPIQAQRHYQRLIHSQPCNPLEMEKSREFCRRSIQECFQGKDDVTRDMIGILCDTHTCDVHLQMLHSNILSVHAFKQEWESHQNELEHWGWGFILLLLGGLGYAIWNVIPSYVVVLVGGTTRRNFHDKKRRSFQRRRWYHALEKQKRF
jgi:hypothetical protein